jgi:glycosyltransferase involved in cell wall biosynthesis
MGGMEKVLCTVMNSLPDHIEQGILSLTEDRNAAKWIHGDHIRFVNFTRPQGNLPFFRALFSSLRQAQPDLLMTYNWGATDAIWLGRLAGIPHIIHSEHGFNVDEAASTQWKRNAIRYLVYRLASKIVVVSSDLQEMMEAQFGLAPARVLFIPNGINTEYFSGDRFEREQMRQMLGLATQDVVVGFVGRLDPVKNLSLLLKVFENCLEHDQHFKLMLVGDGPARAAIERACAHQKFRGRILCVGQQENVVTYLRAMDIFILTSLREQMPMSMLEAMSVGLPVVATAVGEIPIILQGQEAGFVSEIDQAPQQLADALLQLRNQHLRLQMGQAGRNLVVKRFRQQTMIQEYHETLRTLGVFQEPLVCSTECV